MPLTNQDTTITTDPKNKSTTQHHDQQIIPLEDNEEIAMGCNMVASMRIVHLCYEQTQEIIAKILNENIYKIASTLALDNNTKDPTLQEIANNVKLSNDAANATLFHWSNLPEFKKVLAQNAMHSQEVRDVLEILLDIHGPHCNNTSYQMIQDIINHNPDVEKLYKQCIGQDVDNYPIAL